MTQTFLNGVLGVVLSAIFGALALAQETPILAPGNPSIPIDLDGDSASPGFESVGNAIDGNAFNKYLNFGENNSGFIVTPDDGLPAVNAFKISTANDAPERDPATWALFGTNDLIVSQPHSNGAGESWTLVDQGSVTLPTTRLTEGTLVVVNNLTAFTSYRMVFPTVRNAAAANSMQLAEIQFFNVAVQVPLAGDFDVDGGIDLTDFSILTMNLHTDVAALTIQQTFLLGDLTADLRIDGRDFVAFRTAFDEANGVGTFFAMLKAIPEPSTGLLAGAAGALLIWRRRR